MCYEEKRRLLQTFTRQICVNFDDTELHLLLCPSLFDIKTLQDLLINKYVSYSFYLKKKQIKVKNT